MKKLDEALLDAPLHVKSRIGKASKIDLSGGLSSYGFRGRKLHGYDENHNTVDFEGMTAPSEWGREGSKANAKAAETRCLEMSQRWDKEWGDRRFLEVIAREEEVSVRTIERYFKRFPKANKLRQAKYSP